MRGGLLPPSYLLSSQNIRYISMKTNNENKYVIVGVVVYSEFSNIGFLHWIIGNTQEFVLGDINGF